MLIAAMVPSLSLTAAASPTSQWEKRTDVKDKTFDEKGTSVDSYTYYDSDGNAETVEVDSTADVGSKENPISISSEADLILFGQQTSGTSGKYYILDKNGGEYDMDGDNYSMLPLFATKIPSGSPNMASVEYFKGILIGNNATIDNVYIRGTTGDWLITNPGLFGNLYGESKNKPCQIMDLTVKLKIGDVASEYYTYVGGLAAEAYGVVSLSNVTVNVTVGDGGMNNTYVDGLIGYTANSASTLNIGDCNVKSSVSADATIGYYGGLIGSIQGQASATITDCVVTANNIEATYYAGGLVAYVYNSTINAEDCKVTANNGIEVTDSSYGYAGTLLGYVYEAVATFTDCAVDTVFTKNSSDVYWPKAAVGYNDSSTITYSDEDSVSTLRLGSSDVYVALINGTKLTSVVDGITAEVEASGNSTTGSATVDSDGSVTLNVCAGTKTYNLSGEGIIYLEDNTDEDLAAYWVTLDTNSTFSCDGLSAGDSINLLKVYTVSFDSQGGSDVDNQTVASGDKVTEPTAPTKSGYEFKGWYINDEFTTEWDFSGTVTKNMTLYAKFTLIVTITTEPEAISGLTYTGSAQELVTAGEADGGTMYYSLTGDDDDWSTDIPEGTDVGEYIVYYKAVDSYGNSTEVGQVTVEIAEASSSSSSSSSHSGSSHSLSQTTSSSSTTTDTADTATTDTTTTDTTTDTTDTDYVIGGDGGTGASSGSAAETFTDVAETNQYVDAIDYVVNSGLMAGTSSTTFEPETSLTRGMIVTILHRLEGEPESDADHGFNDVEDSAWYATAVVWAAENGVVEGYGDGSFGPDDAITREQLAAILYRYAEYKGYDVSAMASLAGYIDADDIGDWARSAMEWANAEALLDVKGFSYIVPQGEASRAETASTLMTFVENIAK
ncbi:MAG: S-layer homology domain-containing protein [Clostridiales bacterium]|nr:S-layer homology domain-containing protein [Clostridiales bacterium]